VKRLAILIAYIRCEWHCFWSFHGMGEAWAAGGGFGLPTGAPIWIGCGPCGKSFYGKDPAGHAAPICSRVKRSI
jgi:hypothetical protein